MSSRADIINTITQNKPALVPLPTIDFEALIQFDDLVAQFKLAVEKIGGEVIVYSSEEDLSEAINMQVTDKIIINTLNMTEAEKAGLKMIHPADLEQVHIAYFRGKIGVAENSAIWIDEVEMVNRVLPIICEHLVLVLDKSAIVPTMHHAYQLINVAETGYGAFIAGPSKTADIEQSLVIGAHGPRSLKVLLVG